MEKHRSFQVQPGVSLIMSMVLGCSFYETYYLNIWIIFIITGPHDVTLHL